ncbi:DUF2948 family protein [Pelagibius marinus]|uniref:DUF2948 family protein n=1 Tax=Pelagibius marinus TaxID=2762760 RepID=UPI0018721BDB|nr:DUF2948 family protein [Pelagibius marinus]
MVEQEASDDKPLKLRAHDPQDMDVLAALLQDALVPLGDMKYLPEEKRFVLVANRFRWHGDPAEDERPAAPEALPEGADVAFDDEGQPPFERVNSGLCFDKVARVRYRGLKPGGDDEILSLLTITSDPGSVTLIFAGEAAVRLEVEAIRCHMEDLGRPWPTRWRPHHDEGPGSEGGGEQP